MSSKYGFETRDDRKKRMEELDAKGVPLARHVDPIIKDILSDFVKARVKGYGPYVRFFDMNTIDYGYAQWQIFAESPETRPKYAVGYPYLFDVNLKGDEKTMVFYLRVFIRADLKNDALVLGKALFEATGVKVSMALMDRDLPEEYRTWG